MILPESPIRRRLVGLLLLCALAYPVFAATREAPGEVGVPVLKWPALREALGARPRNAYKNRFGHILVLGGDLGMGGAVALAAEAALRVGAGLVSVVSRREHIAAILARRPELMALAADSDGVAERVAMADVIAVGPGLGRGDWGRKQLETAIGSGKPCVVDADGLNLLVDSAAALPPDCVITPHPGEAARLLSCTSAEVQADRFGAVRELAGRYRATAVLKGAGSLVCAPDGVPELCLLGNPGMATAGMGDVLSGVIAGLMGQLPANTAAGLGVCLHSAAGDRVAARQGERGLVALDVVEALLAELNG